MNWPIWIFLVVMVGLFAGLVRTSKPLFIPPMALVLYLAVEHTSLWGFLKVAFWAFIALSVIAILFSQRKLVMIFGASALAISLLAAAFWSWDLDWGGSQPAAAVETTTTTAPPTTTSSTTSTTAVPRDCDTAVVCELQAHFISTDGTDEEEEAEAEILELALDAEDVAQERSYGIDNTTCESGCVLVGGVQGETAEEMAADLLAKGVMSPALVDDAARLIIGATYSDVRPVGDLVKAASDLEIVLGFITSGTTVDRGTIPVGTTVWNTVVRDGRVVQFQYTTRRERAFVSFAGSVDQDRDAATAPTPVTLMFFDTCGNRVSFTPVPGVPEVPEEEIPHDDKDPSQDPEQQGNNREGGGGTAPPVTGPATPPAAGDPPAVYVPPAAPAPDPNATAPGAEPADPNRPVPPNEGAPPAEPVPPDPPAGPVCDPAICTDA